LGGSFCSVHPAVSLRGNQGQSWMLDTEDTVPHQQVQIYSNCRTTHQIHW